MKDRDRDRERQRERERLLHSVPGRYGNIYVPRNKERMRERAIELTEIYRIKYINREIVRTI